MLATSILHAAPSPSPPHLEDFLKSGEESLQRRDFGGAEENFTAALQLARESQDIAAQAIARRGLARSMFFYPEGEAEARLARVLHHGLHDEAGEVADLLVLSENYQTRSYFSKALEVLAEALAIEQRSGLHVEEAKTLEKQASVQRIMGSYEEALASMKAALNTLPRNGFMSSAEVRLTTRLGDLSADLGRYDEAEKYLTAAVADARSLESQISPSTWARLRETPSLKQNMLETFHATAELLSQKEGSAPDYSSDPELLRLTLDAYAEDREQQSRRLRETEQALISLEAASPTNPLGKELQYAWNHWVQSMHSALHESKSRPVIEQELIHGAAAFDHAALSYWHIQAVPEGWYANQAKRLTTILRVAGYGDTAVTEAQIISIHLEETEDSSSVFLPLFDHAKKVEEARAPARVKEAGSTYRFLAEGAAKQARAFRQALESGKLDDEVTKTLTASAKSRHIVSSAMRTAFADLQFDFTGDELDVIASLNCQVDALTNLGRIYQKLGHREKAMAKNNEAWNVFEKSQTSTPGELDSLKSLRKDFGDARKLGLPIPTSSNCGDIKQIYYETLWSADLKAAKGQTKEAIKDYLLNAARNATLQPTAWQRVATLYAMIGAKDQAMEYYRQAIDATEAVQGQLHRGELVASWASHQESLYAQAIRLLYDLNQPAQGFEYAERARASAFLNQIGTRRLPAVGVPAELVERLQDVRQRLIELEGQEQGGGGFGRDTEATRKLYKQLLNAVTRVNPEYASLLKVDTVTLTQVQGEILDDHTSLIEYFALDDKLLAWVIDRDAVTWLALPLSASRLHEQISYLRDLIATRKPSRTEAASLYEALFAPLEPYLRHHNVIVVPQGPLHFLPFGALWNAKNSRYVAQDYALTLAPSASVLRFVHRNLRPAASTLLALGNPDGSLPHAEEEVRAIAHLFNATPWIGKEALESRLHQEAGGAGIVHLAAHATYDSLRPFLTRIDLAADHGGSAADGKSDGHLHVYEIYGLDLKSANLVVLSACGTALGPHDEGDDLIGLPRAFLYAGAPAVLSTLWSVDDKATAIFMQAFYNRIRQGMPAAESLQAAQHDLLGRAETREPYFWAGFTLTGSAETANGIHK